MRQRSKKPSLDYAATVAEWTRARACIHLRQWMVTDAMTSSADMAPATRLVRALLQRIEAREQRRRVKSDWHQLWNKSRDTRAPLVSVLISEHDRRRVFLEMSISDAICLQDEKMPSRCMMRHYTAIDFTR